MTANLFDEEPKVEKKKRGWLQKAVLGYLRSGHSITEESYKRDFGGASISAVLHNLKIRGLLEPGEFIVRDKVKDSTGNLTPSYRLAKESPRVDFSQKEPELDPKSFESEPEIGAFAEEPRAEDFPEWGVVGVVEEYEEPPESMDSPPEVSSIMVGVRGSQPELVIMFKGDFKPLRHAMSHMEVRYLMANLQAFMPRRKDG